MINIDNEKRYKVLQSATSKISKVIQKAAQMESCKNTPENYEKFLFTLQAKATKHKAATIS